MAFGIDDFLAGAAGGILDYAANENLQDQAQGFNAHEAELQRQFNSAEALANRTFQARMSNTAVQRHARDLRRAGFNPLLAVHPGGGATTPSGSAASSGMASSPGASSHPNFAASMASAAQIDLIEAEAAKVRAEEKEVIARTPRHAWDIKEIEARIPKHQEEVNSLQQQIRESSQRIEKMFVEMDQHHATARNLEQHTINLKATLPHIQAQINQLRALAAKESAETDEIKQRITENLPQLERTLGNLEALRRRMAQPGEANAERAADSFLGQLGAYLKSITSIIPNTGIILNPNRRR